MLGQDYAYRVVLFIFLNFLYCIYAFIYLQGSSTKNNNPNVCKKLSTSLNSLKRLYLKKALISKYYKTNLQIDSTQIAPSV